MGTQCLHTFSVKDCDRDSCEHCGREYWNSLKIKDLGKLRCKVHCDACIEAERSLDRICEVMNRTKEKKQLLKRSENNKREEFEALLAYQRVKMKAVLTNIRNFTKEQRCSEPKPPSSEPRLPYKE